MSMNKSGQELQRGFLAAAIIIIVVIVVIVWWVMSIKEGGVSAATGIQQTILGGLK